MAKARVGAGTQIQYGNGASPEVFAVIPKIKEIDFGGIEVSLEDITTLDSTMSNGLIFKEWLATLADGKDLTLNGLYDPTDTAQQAVQDEIDGKPHNFKIVVRDLTTSPIATLVTISFSAFVQNWNPKFQVDKAMPLSIKLKITGPVTFA
jgi:hypothetical protein